MIIGEGPVDEVEVQIIQPQIPERLGAGEEHVSLAVHIVPHFGGDEELFPLHHAFPHGFLKDLADQVLIAVHGRAVKQAVSAADGAGHGVGYLLGGEAVAAEGAHADALEVFSAIIAEDPKNAAAVKSIVSTAPGGGTRLILSRDEVAELIRVFLPAGSNETRLIDQVDGYLNKVVDLGFARRLRGQEEMFEVRRILKAFVDAQWLNELDQRLAAYQERLGRPGEREDD